MGFIQDIASVLPTIMGVITPLFNAKTNDYLRYSLGNDTNDVNGKRYIAFRKEGDKIMACNPFNEPVALVFPERNGINGETVTIPATDHWPVTSMMVERACANVDDFQILKGGIQDDGSANGLADNENLEATISATGKVANADGQSKIGTALGIKINGNDLSVIVNPPYSLDGIASLEISGDSDQPCRLFKNTLNDGSTPSPVQSKRNNVSPLEMKFPDALDSLKDSKKLFVSISARCSCPASHLKTQAKRGKKAQESDWDFLKTGRCLNE